MLFKENYASMNKIYTHTHTVKATGIARASRSKQFRPFTVKYIAQERLYVRESIIVGYTPINLIDAHFENNDARA